MTVRCAHCGKDTDDGPGLIAMLMAAALGALALYGVIQILALFS